MSRISSDVTPGGSREGQGGRDCATTAEQVSAELRSLMNDEDKKWFYAYAMGARCTTEENNEISMAIGRDAGLRARGGEPREGCDYG